MPAKYATGDKSQFPLRRHQRGRFRSIARHADEPRKHSLRHYNVIHATRPSCNRANLLTNFFLGSLLKILPKKSNA